ncbi:stage II sporulation protein M, partial [Haladaptatus sp.]|uniref:stage II sporulation protein M n=1 Tax=Haladaptatus sp. TaxID=1973141 RepID=UPI003C4133C8
LPHGVIEIPGLSVAGALGLHLGGVSLSYVRGRTSVDEFSGELVRAYYVVLGLLPVFIVAAFIEAFVTWWVAAHVV